MYLMDITNINFTLYENLILLCEYSDSYNIIKRHLDLNYMNVNYVNFRDKTMLTSALNYNNYRIVKLLLDYGATIYVSYTRSQITNRLPLHYALDINLTYDSRIIEVMLRKFPEIINLQYYSDNTLLHICVKNYCKNILFLDSIKVLLLFGANIYIKNLDGKTCLDIVNSYDSLESCNISVCKELFDKYDYVKNGARHVLKRFLLNIIYKPPNGCMYKRALKSFNNSK